jgi:hypothetical protein
MIVGWHDLRDVFHDVTLERGLDYARRGRVRNARLTELPDDGVRIEAEVHGSAFSNYQTAVTVGTSGAAGPPIECVCTCPVGYNCKHGAATLIEFYKLEPVSAVSTSAEGDSVESLTAVWSAPAASGSPTAVCSAGPTPPLVHATWLAQLRALSSEAPTAPRTQRMVYVIGIEPYRKRPLVKLLYGNVRKDGSLARLKPANASLFDLLRNQPRYLGDADVPLVRALALASTPGSPGGHVLERDGALLSRLVDEGEAMVNEPAGQTLRPLRRGQARSASGRWHPDARGRQRFMLAVDPPADVVALDGLWFLDAGRGELGEINADLDAQLAQVLLHAPPIDTARGDPRSRGDEHRARLAAGRGSPTALANPNRRERTARARRSSSTASQRQGLGGGALRDTPDERGNSLHARALRQPACAPARPRRRPLARRYAGDADARHKAAREVSAPPAFGRLHADASSPRPALARKRLLPR